MTKAFERSVEIELDCARFFGARRALSLVWAARKILGKIGEGPALTPAAAVELSERITCLMELAEMEIEGLAETALEDADRELI